MDSSRSEWCDQNHSITLPNWLDIPDGLNSRARYVNPIWAFVLPAHQAEQAAGRDLGAR